MLYVLLWGLIWLMGQLAPSWLQLDLKLAIRSLFAARSRNASTLLALVVGVLTLSLLTLLVNAVRQRFVEQLVRDGRQRDHLRPARRRRSRPSRTR